MLVPVFVQTFVGVIDHTPFLFRLSPEQVRRVLLRLLFRLPAFPRLDCAVVRERFSDKLKIVRILVRGQLWRVAVRVESSVWSAVHSSFSSSLNVS